MAAPRATRCALRRAEHANAEAAAAAAAAAVAVVCAVQDLLTRVEADSDAARGGAGSPGAAAVGARMQALRASNETLKTELCEREAFFDAELDALRESAAEAEEAHARALRVVEEEARCTAAAALQAERKASAAAVQLKLVQQKEQREQRERCMRVEQQQQQQQQLKLQRRADAAEMMLEDMYVRLHSLQVEREAACNRSQALEALRSEDEAHRTTLGVAMDEANVSARKMSQDLLAAERQIAAYEERERRHLAEDRLHEQALAEAVDSAAQTAATAKSRLRDMETALSASRKEAGELRGRNGVLHASVEALQATVDELRGNIRTERAAGAEAREDAESTASEVGRAHAEATRRARAEAEKVEIALRVENAAMAEKLARLVVFFEARQDRGEELEQFKLRERQEQEAAAGEPEGTRGRQYPDYTAALELAQRRLEAEQREKLAVQRKLETLVQWFEKMQAAEVEAGGAGGRSR